MVTQEIIKNIGKKIIRKFYVFTRKRDCSLIIPKAGTSQRKKAYMTDRVGAPAQARGAEQAILQGSRAGIRTAVSSSISASR